MNHFIVFISVAVLFICGSHSSPLDNKDTNKDSKSAFGQAFDEIVVESHLTVRRKSNGRQGRTQNVTNQAEAGILKTKREIHLPVHSSQTVHHNTRKFPLKPFDASAASSQSQAFNSFGPLGSFGASSTSSQSQTIGRNNNAGFSGKQQYVFNGQTIDIAFGSAFSKDGRGGAVVTVTGPDGKKHPLEG